MLTSYNTCSYSRFSLLDCIQSQIIYTDPDSVIQLMKCTCVWGCLFVCLHAYLYMCVYSQFKRQLVCFPNHAATCIAAQVVSIANQWNRIGKVQVVVTTNNVVVTMVLQPIEVIKLFTHYAIYCVLVITYKLYSDHSDNYDYNYSNTVQP